MLDITHRIMSHHSATTSPLQLLQLSWYNNDSGDINHINKKKKKYIFDPRNENLQMQKKIDREKSPTRTEPDEVRGYSGRSVLYINQQRTHPHQRNPSF